MGDIITAFTELTTAPAADDQLPLVDVSDTTQAATGTTKRQSWLNHIKHLFASRFAEDAGANDTYTATLFPAPTAYETGQHYRFKANTANTGAATINFNALGAKAIKKHRDQDPADGDIEAGQWVDLVYDGTNMQMQSQLGNAPAGAGSIAPLTLIDANTVHQKNSTTSQVFSVFKTTTDNHKLSLQNVSSAFEIASSIDAGTPENIKIVIGTAKYAFSTTSLIPPANQAQELGASATRWSVTYSAQFNAKADDVFRWHDSTKLSAPADGMLMVKAHSGSTAKLVFNDSGSSAPMLKNDSTRLEVKLADDSAYTQLTCLRLGVNNSAAATSLGSVTKKTEIFDAAGASLGFVAIYDAIT